MEHSKSFIRETIAISTKRGSSNIRALVSLSLIAILSAGCSGGGGGGGDVPANVAPATATTCQTTERVTNLMGDLNNFVTDPDSMMFSFSRTVDGTKGTVTINTDGTYMYIPNMGETGFDSFTYEVDDLDGNTSTGTVDVLIGRTRIMTVGDSYTNGTSPPVPYGENVGYRQKLYNDLTANNQFIDFVGSQSNGLTATPPIVDPDNHGIPGSRDDQILTGGTFMYPPALMIPTITIPALDGQLTLTPADIMLLHVGTNDINRDAAANNGTDPVGAQEVEMILNAIDIWEAANNPVTVFVAQIIERATAATAVPPLSFPNPNIAAFNANIAALVASRPTDNIVLVDMNSALISPLPTCAIGMEADCNDYRPDRIHPTPEGYDKMADTWRAALESSGALSVCVP